MQRHLKISSIALLFSLLLSSADGANGNATPQASTQAALQAGQIDWTRITLEASTIQGFLERIHKALVLKKNPKDFKQPSSNQDVNQIDRADVVAIKGQLEAFVRNPDLEEASVCSRNWFVEIWKSVNDMDSVFNKFQLAQLNNSQEQYVSAVSVLDKKRAALGRILANPIRLTQTQYAAVKAANEKRRAQYAAQLKELKKRQGK